MYHLFNEYNNELEATYRINDELCHIGGCDVEGTGIFEKCLAVKCEKLMKNIFVDNRHQIFVCHHADMFHYYKILNIDRGLVSFLTCSKDGTHGLPMNVIFDIGKYLITNNYRQPLTMCFMKSFMHPTNDYSQIMEEKTMLEKFFGGNFTISEMKWWGLLKYLKKCEYYVFKQRKETKEEHKKKKLIKQILIYQHGWSHRRFDESNEII